MSDTNANNEVVEAANNNAEEEETNPLLNSTSAISTSPYEHKDTILRNNFLTEKYHENQLRQKHAKEISSHNRIIVFCWDLLSSIKIFVTMLISMESVVGCLLTVGATLLAYYSVPNEDISGVGNSSSSSVDWNGSMPTVLLSFAVITPLSQSISMAFQRRENALKSLSIYRSGMYNLYVAHCSWNWSVCSKGKGRRGCVENAEDEAAIYGDQSTSFDEIRKAKSIDWLNHSDTTLCHLIHLSDSLHQYLTLPFASRARHRATSKGRLEANEVLTAGRDIFTLNVYGRMIMISQLTEALKYRGMPGNEASRIRQWENNMTNAMEDLRIVKEYRTLQALRVFERLFTMFLPPFYATSYVQVALDTGSLALGIALGVITSIALTGLFECVRKLEDPFVSHVTLDGIDVREELVVLAYQELMVARKLLFPSAKGFVLKRDIFEADNINPSRNEHEDHRRSRHVPLPKLAVVGQRF